MFVPADGVEGFGVFDGRGCLEGRSVVDADGHGDYAVGVDDARELGEHRVVAQVVLFVWFWLFCLLCDGEFRVVVAVFTHAVAPLLASDEFDVFAWNPLACFLIENFTKFGVHVPPVLSARLAPEVAVPGFPCGVPAWAPVPVSIQFIIEVDLGFLDGHTPWVGYVV